MQYKTIAEDLILKHETIESFPLWDDEKIFIAGYINAISFTEDWRGIAERAGYDLDSGLDGFIAPDFIRKAICDCLGFMSAAPARIWMDGLRTVHSNNHWHDPELIREIASLFWYTRNGMGSGFFDSDSKKNLGNGRRCFAVESRRSLERNHHFLTIWSLYQTKIMREYAHEK